MMTMMMMMMMMIIHLTDTNCYI